jgi:hypothetical protein
MRLSNVAVKNSGCWTVPTIRCVWRISSFRSIVKSLLASTGVKSGNGLVAVAIKDAIIAKTASLLKVIILLLDHMFLLLERYRRIVNIDDTISQFHLNILELIRLCLSFHNPDLRLQRRDEFFLDPKIQGAK